MAEAIHRKLNLSYGSNSLDLGCECWPPEAYVVSVLKVNPLQTQNLGGSLA